MESLRHLSEELSRLVDGQMKTLSLACDRVDRRISHCNQHLTAATERLCTSVNADLRIANEILNKEHRSKLLHAQWCNHFIAEAEYEELNPITFAFVRFCLNIAASYNDVSYESLIEADVHTFLVSLLSSPEDIVVGPALLALCHISLKNEVVKHDIVHAGALPRLLHITVTFTSRPVLAQAAKLCASLALHLPNKSLIAFSG
jgi:hypothetical protein